VASESPTAGITYSWKRRLVGLEPQPPLQGIARVTHVAESARCCESLLINSLNIYYIITQLRSVSCVFTIKIELDWTKLYFVIFAAFKDIMILNLAQRSYILAAMKSPCTLYRPLIITSVLSCPISEILVVLYVQSQFFHTHSYSG